MTAVTNQGSIILKNYSSLGAGTGAALGAAFFLAELPPVALAIIALVVIGAVTTSTSSCGRPIIDCLSEEAKPIPDAPKCDINCKTPEEFNGNQCDLSSIKVREREGNNPFVKYQPVKDEITQYVRSTIFQEFEIDACMADKLTDVIFVPEDFNECGSSFFNGLYLHYGTQKCHKIDKAGETMGPTMLYMNFLMEKTKIGWKVEPGQLYWLSLERALSFPTAFVHEMGHHVHFMSCFRKFEKTSWDTCTIKKKESEKKDFLEESFFNSRDDISLRNCAEEFAVSFEKYILHPGYFRYIAEKNPKVYEKYQTLKSGFFNQKEYARYWDALDIVQYVRMRSNGESVAEGEQGWKQKMLDYIMGNMPSLIALPQNKQDQKNVVDKVTSMIIYRKILFNQSDNSEPMELAFDERQWLTPENEISVILQTMQKYDRLDSSSRRFTPFLLKGIGDLFFAGIEGSNIFLRTTSERAICDNWDKARSAFLIYKNLFERYSEYWGWWLHEDLFAETIDKMIYINRTIKQCPGYVPSAEENIVEGEYCGLFNYFYPEAEIKPNNCTE